MATYQGWKNYQTWAAKLWIDNEYSLYKESQRLVKKFGRSKSYELSEALKELFEMPDLEGLAGDLLTSAWDLIDWREIANSYLGDLDDEDGESDDDDEDESDDEDEEFGDA